MVSRLVTYLYTIFVITVFWHTPSLAQYSDAKQNIERLNAMLLSIMLNSTTLNFEKRYQKLAPVLHDSFDLKFMAKFSAGRYWRQLSHSDQQQVISAFKDLWVATYADRFDSHTGEIFEIVSVEPAPQETVLVKTNIVRENNSKIKINYLLRKNIGKWLVIDIFLKGKYSELAKQRAQYSSVLKRDGVKGLISKVEQKILKMGQKSSN